jgi:hypothetical protein
MSSFIGIIVGAVEIVAGIVTEVLVGWTGFGAVLGGLLISAGAGMILSGLGTLISGSSQSQQGSGVAFASRNPIKSWDIQYGHGVVGGNVVYLNEFGDSNKYLDMVIVLTAHQCQSVDRLLFDKQFVQLNSNGDSFSPVQQTVNIQHIVRQNGVVTVTLGADIPLLQVGDRIAIQNVTGDHTLNGTYPVSEIVSQVYVLGTPGSLVFRYICGGATAVVDNEGQTVTKWADYGAKVHMEVMLGTQTLGTTFPGMISGTASDGDLTNLITPAMYGVTNPWNANCSLVGKTAVFLRLHYDATVWSGGLPSISFLIHGKNDIYDPRLGSFGGGGTTAYTENAALIIADYLSNTTWGFKAAYGTEIPLTPLIAEANICDEDVPLAIGGATTYNAGTISTTNGLTAITGSGTAWTSAMDGGAIIIGGFIGTILSASATSITLRVAFAGATGSGFGYEIYYGAGFEARYAANGTFDLSRRRGEILQNLLTSCAGRLSYQGGQFVLQTGAWRGSSPAPAPSMGSMSGGFRWKPTVQIRDLYNGVKGTYISPANNWHPSDIPPYAQDTLHGYSGPLLYGGDSNLAADGGDRRWLDMQLPFTISPSLAQRLCKIELLRRRNQGTGTFRYNMIGYQFTALDVISMTLPLFSWSGKLLEITAHRFVLDKQQAESGAEVVALGTEIDVQETDSAVYDWSTTEELTPEGYQQATAPNPFTPAPPTGLVLTSNLETAVSTAAGLADAILVAWTQPLDGYVISGGHIEVQYEELFSYLAGTVSVTSGSTNVTGLGTAWTAEMEGGSFVIGGVRYNIATVSSATALILTALFAGITATGQSYAIQYPGPWIGLPSVNPSVTQVLINGVDDGALYNVQIRSVNAGGFPSAWVSGSVTAEGSALPLPWKPGGEAYAWANSGWSFLMNTPQGPGILTAYGFAPVNEFSQSATVGPVVDQYAMVVRHLGNVLPVMNGIIQVFGIDSGGARTPGSNVSQLNVASAASRISFGVSWGANTVGYEVFVGAGIDSLVGLGPVTPGSMPATITLNSLSPYPAKYGPPDPRAVTTLMRAKQVIHGGIASAIVVSSSGTTSIVIGVPGAASANEYVGRYLIRANNDLFVGINRQIIGPITASDTGSPNCTLTVAAGANYLTNGDLILLSTLSDTNTATSIGDSGLVSPFAPSGLTTNAEIGELVRVLNDPTGAATGAVATVISNTSTVAATGQFRLPNGDAVTPGAGSQFIFELASWGPQSHTSLQGNSVAPAGTAYNGTFPLATLNINALGGEVALVQVLLANANGNLSDETTDTLRIIYVPPSSIAADGYYPAITPAAGVATVDLANGLNQVLVLNATAVTIPAPVYTGEALIDGAWFTLYLRQDTTGNRALPTFTHALAAFCGNAANVISYSPDANTDTAVTFTLRGGYWIPDLPGAAFN